MNFKDIVNWSLNIDKINVSQVLNYPNNFLKIKIINNKVEVISCELLSNGSIEERQNSIINMLNEVCDHYEISDLVMTYCTHDKSNVFGPIFTHSRLRGVDNQNILAPCFTFDSYSEGPNSIPVNYNETFNTITLNTNIEWEEKDNALVFVGHVGENNNRLNNTNLKLNDGVDLKVFNQQSTSENFISRESLSKFKYLLHLNGNGGAYASRFKYLLGNKSLVFYNYNSGDVDNFWEEWWMYDKFFKENVHYISCKDKYDVEKKIEYFYRNQDEAKKISENGFNFFIDHLNKKNVLKYWSELLNEYSKRLIY